MRGKKPALHGIGEPIMHSVDLNKKEGVFTQGGREDGLQKLKNNHGFTLIELMIVMTIVGILLTIAQPMYKESTIKAKEAVLMENLFSLRDVIDQFYVDKNKYPDSLDELAENQYIRSVPKDPFTGSRESWQLVSPPEGYEGGIYDVHSGSDLISLDGTPYNEW